MDPRNPFQPNQNQGQPPMLEHHGPVSGYPQQQAQVPQAAPQNSGWSAQPQPQYQPQPQPVPQTVPPAAAQLGQVANQYPVDYLNQISAPAPVKKMSPIMLFGIIGGVLLATVIAMFIMVRAAAPPDVGTQVLALQARIDTLLKVSGEQKKHIAQNDLSNINSIMQTQLKSTAADVSGYISSKKIITAKDASKDKRVIAANSAETPVYTKLSQKLNNAYLMGTLDQTFSSEMAYQLTMLKSMMQRVKSSARNKAFTELYTKNIESLDVITTQFNKFQGTQ